QYLCEQIDEKTHFPGIQITHNPHLVEIRSLIENENKPLYSSNIALFINEKGELELGLTTKEKLAQFPLYDTKEGENRTFNFTQKLAKGAKGTTTIDGVITPIPLTNSFILIRPETVSDGGAAVTAHVTALLTKENQIADYVLDPSFRIVGFKPEGRKLIPIIEQVEALKNKATGNPNLASDVLSSIVSLVIDPNSKTGREELGKTIRELVPVDSHLMKKALDTIKDLLTDSIEDITDQRVQRYRSRNQGKDHLSKDVSYLFDFVQKTIIEDSDYGTLLSVIKSSYASTTFHNLPSRAFEALLNLLISQDVSKTSTREKAGYFLSAYKLLHEMSKVEKSPQKQMSIIRTLSKIQPFLSPLMALIPSELLDDAGRRNMLDLVKTIHASDFEPIQPAVFKDIISTGSYSRDFIKAANSAPLTGVAGEFLTIQNARASQRELVKKELGPHSKGAPSFETTDALMGRRFSEITKQSLTPRPNQMGVYKNANSLFYKFEESLAKGSMSRFDQLASLALLRAFGIKTPNVTVYNDGWVELEFEGVVSEQTLTDQVTPLGRSLLDILKSSESGELNRTFD
ncbi:MAG: hypothetical protein AABZ14_08925, partial [Candidatus Margulisiibacteriota bacterium]